MDRDKPVRAITSGSRQIVLLRINRSNGSEIDAFNIFHTRTNKADKSCKDVQGFIPLTKLPVELIPVNQDADVAMDFVAENSVRVAVLLVNCGSPYYGH